MRFDEIDFEDEVLDGLYDMNFEEMTPVQEATIPVILEGSDLIAGFSGETEQEHEATLSLMREVGYEFAYMFKYSERPGTFAHEHLPDDVPDEVKSRRLSEIIALQNELGHASNLRDVGREFEVLVEGRSKRDEKQLSGRTSQNKVVVFDRGRHDVGDYVRVRITGCTPATLFGEEII